ncbi:MAG: response regulator [Opitutales bacterium]
MNTKASSFSKDHHVDVLFVDDSPNLRRTMQLWFQTKGYSVLTCESADEAEQMAAASPPGMMITDLGLPDRSGYALLKTLRQSEALSQTYFVAFSGDTLEQEKARALEAGFDCFLRKPPDFDVLSKLLETRLRRQSDGDAVVAN